MYIDDRPTENVTVVHHRMAVPLLVERVYHRREVCLTAAASDTYHVEVHGGDHKLL